MRDTNFILLQTKAKVPTQPAARVIVHLKTVCNIFETRHFTFDACFHDFNKVFCIFMQFTKQKLDLKSILSAFWHKYFGWRWFLCLTGSTPEFQHFPSMQVTDKQMWTLTSTCQNSDGHTTWPDHGNVYHSDPRYEQKSWPAKTLDPS